MNSLIAIAVIGLAGIFLALQAPINSVLAARLDNAIAAATISFGVGFGCLAVLLVAVTSPPRLNAFHDVPWWAWTGGALGSFFVWAAIWSVSRIGVVSIAAALIVGQMGMALVIDRYGLFGLPIQELTASRLLGVLLVAGGLVMTRL